MRFQTFQAEQKRYSIAVRVTISIIGGCICELKTMIRFALRGHIWTRYAYHCAHPSCSDIVEFAINVANLVTRLPRWAEERDNFPVGVLELEKSTKHVNDFGDATSVM